MLVNLMEMPNYQETQVVIFRQYNRSLCEDWNGGGVINATINSHQTLVVYIRHQLGQVVLNLLRFTSPQVYVVISETFHLSLSTQNSFGCNQLCHHKVTFLATQSLSFRTEVRNISQIPCQSTFQFHVAGEIFDVEK